jgi:hypothetical protein
MSICSLKYSFGISVSSEAIDSWMCACVGRRLESLDSSRQGTNGHQRFELQAGFNANALILSTDVEEP